MSSCDIDLDYYNEYDDEYIESAEYEETTTEDIRCIECKQTIPANTTFITIQLDSYTDDTCEELIVTNYYKTCIGCTQVKNIFFTYSYMFGQIWQDIWDYCFGNDEFPESKFQLLGPEGKEIFLQEWEKYHEEEKI